VRESDVFDEDDEDGADAVFSEEVDKVDDEGKTASSSTASDELRLNLRMEDA
jgi:hypothetical protein